MCVASVQKHSCGGPCRSPLSSVSSFSLLTYTPTLSKVDSVCLVTAWQPYLLVVFHRLPMVGNLLVLLLL